MDKIKLTPSELLQQAGEMDALEKEYDALSSRVDSVLKQVNNNWSKNLSRNFSGKISSAQRSFSTVVDSLKQGATIAKTSARSFEEIDSLLAKGISGDADAQKKLDHVSGSVLMMKDPKGINNLACSFSADPVNLANGNFVLEKDYLQIDSSVPMSFHMFYNSNNDNRGVLGVGWIHNYEIHMRRLDDHIAVERYDGSEQLFVEEGGRYVSVNGTFAVLEKTTEGYCVVDDQQTKWFFDEKGYLVSCENMAEDRVTLEYDNAHKLIKVLNESGDYYTFEYDSCGCLCCVADLSGRRVDISVEDGRMVSVSYGDVDSVKYDYDEKGLLTLITNGRGIRTLLNEYDNRGRVVAQTFADGGRVSYVYHDEDHSVDMIQQNGAVITYYHDAFNRNLKTVYPCGSEISTYNKHNQQDAFIDRRGNTSFYTYDEKGNVVEYINARRDVLTLTHNQRGQVVSASLNGELQYSVSYDEGGRIADLTDGLGGKTCYEYDEKGNVVSCTQPDGSVQYFEYDEYGHVKTATNTMGGKIGYEYDNLHRVVKTTDALGNVTEFTYDDADRIIASVDAMGYKKTYKYDESGNVTEYTDGNGSITRAAYTPMNKIEALTDPDGNVTQFQYDLMWNLIRMINADGGEESFAYDEMNNMISAVDAEGGENRFEYDAGGNMTQRTDPEGGVHKIAYDELNRPVEVTDPMGRVARAEYNAHGGETCVTHPDGSKTLQEFDSLGRVVSLTDRCGYEQKYTYNAMGQVTQIEDKLGIKEKREYYPGGLLKTVFERSGASTTYEYDEAERIVAIINENGGKWTVEYDSIDRPVRICADGKLAEAYEYDAEGNVVVLTDGNGTRTCYRYSAGGNMIAMTDATGYETSFEYDARNNLVKVVQPEFKKDDIADINEQNRRVRETVYRRDKRGLVLEEIDAEGNLQSYAYDKCGRVISCTDADGHRVETEYYADGLKKAFRFSDGKSVLMQYDALKQLVILEDSLGITRIIRDEKTGLPQTVTNPQGETLSYEWNENGERKSICFPDGKVQTFEYDDKGLLKAMTLDGEAVNYEYDNSGRLRRKIYPNGLSTEYDFDKLGYISRMAHKSKDDILEEYEYSYSYPGKKSGMHRKSSEADWSGDYTYRYDIRGSLIGVDKDGVEVEGYKYDCFGNRIYSRINGQESRYTYNRLDQLISMEDNDGVHGYKYDRRGNLIEETSGGRTVLEMQFDAAGMLEFARSDRGTAEYLYNGFGYRYEENINLEGKALKRRFGYDITKDNRNMLFMVSDNVTADIFRDNEIVGVAERDKFDFFMNDALSNPIRLINNDGIKACQYTAFGCQQFADGAFGDDWYGQAFIGYTVDPITGLYHSPRREYSPVAGRFVSKDEFSGNITVPLSYHRYHYCLGDSINYWDPSGAIWAQLGAGIVGAVAKVATKAAGDIAKTVVSSVKNGKFTPQVSSWQDYVGSAVGGFAEGTVLATTGSFALAGAAGSAAETLTANGLKMATGVEGYRKEDGYTLGTLMADTAKSGVSGAVTGAAGGFIFKNAGSALKIDGINAGKGSCMSIFKANVTKASRGLIKEMTWKSVGKGILVYGGVGLINGTISGTIKGAKKEIDGWLKKKAGELIGDKRVGFIEDAYNIWDNLGKSKAYCKATR